MARKPTYLNNFPFKRGIRVCGATIGLASNNESLITDPQYFESMILQSLLTDVWRVENVPYENVDAELWVHDVPGAPISLEIDGMRLIAEGDFTEAEKSCSDNRYSLFGNLGLLFKYLLVVLERRSVFSFHASAIYREAENRLVMFTGPAASGKTVFILSAIEQGWKVLTVEMAHCEFRGNDLVIHKGALYDNVRVGNLTIDFPGAIEPLKIKIPEVTEVWGHKFAIDMNPVAVEADCLVNPQISVVFPKVEMGRGDPEISPAKKGRGLRRRLFDNLTEKIGSTFLLYDELPIQGFDSPELGAARLEFADEFMVRITEARSVLTGPKSCMKGI
ncbi:MAG TPA: hypothetical protein VFI02_15420 [Armatimonadota bacterium]|nr:hypothetical protein [Armatimonadota bacterium]